MSEISFAVNEVFYSVASPLESHWVVVKRIIRYLKGIIQLGCGFYHASIHKPLSLKAFCDLGDWAADPDDRHSTFMGSIDFALVPTSSLGVVP